MAYFKTIVFLFSVFICTTAFGQKRPTGLYQPFTFPWERHYGWVEIDSAVLLASRDTGEQTIMPAIRIWQHSGADTSVWFNNGSAWQRLATGLPADSSFIINPHFPGTQQIVYTTSGKTVYSDTTFTLDTANKYLIVSGSGGFGTHTPSNRLSVLPLTGNTSDTLSGLQLTNLSSGATDNSGLTIHFLSINNTGDIDYKLIDTVSTIATKSNLPTQYWQLVGNDLFPVSNAYWLGIGGAPSYPLDIQYLNGRFSFDGTRLLLNDELSDNMSIGSGSAQSADAGDVADIAFGLNAFRQSHGSYTVSIGLFSTNASSYANRVTAIGANSLTQSDSVDNSAYGYNSGAENYGQQDVAIGSGANNSVLLNSSTINNSEIVVSTKTISGTGTASFISSNSLVTGVKYPTLVVFNSTPPAPYSSSSSVFFQITVTNSNTITITNPAFTTQGSGNFTINLYSKETNAIALGYNSRSDSSNEIMLGNTSNTVLKSNQFVVDLTSVPLPNQLLTWDSVSAKAKWKYQGIKDSIPTTGNTITGNTNPYLIIDAVDTIATLTVKFPASPTNGQPFNILSVHVITTLTLDGNGKTVLGGITTLLSNGFAGWVYDSTIGDWVRKN